ncbi:4,5-DOPA dioxygenase extradiol [Reichenbachiella ulvae]|uniref:4,5-DOPA dioxygenase extradiol n=1 Tax=Reichenbachiella ulvae TaxID=2980104 RepID=A0ABT3CPA6_9BACT|nr:4,5-DOPA dioxygenase extradiol [Reichenbachiella ulvae]MCV9385540.1 4,5-DOPA dioxygenase extradiol [Reichenbachiella ulvae]
MNRQDFIKAASLGTAGLFGYKMKAFEEWNKSGQLENSPTMPVFFVGHGNPMNAIMENDITKGWREAAKGIEPKAILVVSAHWQTRGTMVTMTPEPETIHDFGGFPKALFDVQYPAPGSPEMARQVIDHMKNHTVEEDHEWGLDHGTWSVLIKMFPDADVPVFQLSLDYRMSPKEHYELAQELQFLRNKGVLIVGSGNIVHNLRKARWQDDQAYDWAKEFDVKTKELIESQNHDQLVHYEKLGSDALLSIPTSEHYLPMLYTLALRTPKDKLEFFNESILMGSMSMRSFVISNN